MNKRTGKLLSLLLTLAMVLGMLPAMSLTAFAAEPGISITGSTADSSGTGWSYVKSTKTLTLSGYNGDYIQGSGLSTLNLVLEGTSTITVNDTNAKGIALGNNQNLNISGSGSLTINATGGSNLIYGIECNKFTMTSGTVTINANSSKMVYGVNANDSLSVTGGKLTANIIGTSDGRGLYCKTGKLTVDSGAEVAVKVTNNGSNNMYGIYNNAYTESVTDNGDIELAGAVTVTRDSGSTGSGNVYGIANSSSNSNTDGVISITGGSVTVTNAYYGIVAFTKGHDTAFADVVISGGTVNVTSTTSDSLGIVSWNNGVTISGGTVTASTASKALLLFDQDSANKTGLVKITGDAKVSLTSSTNSKALVVQEDNSNTSTRVHQINLTSGGSVTVKSTSSEETDYAFPVQGYFNLGSSTKITKGSFRSTPDGTNAGGGKLFQADSTTKQVVVAYSTPAPGANSVSVNGHNFASPTKLYYKNDGTDTTNDSTDYNAYYNPATGVLELKNYNSGPIMIGGSVESDITIKLVGNNVINSNSQFGIVNNNGGDITITAGSDATLTINVNNDSYYAFGIACDIPGSYASRSRAITISGKANVTVNATATSTEYNKNAVGISTKGTVAIKEDASFKAVCKSSTPSTGLQSAAGIYGYSGVTINTTGKVDIDISQCSGAYNYGIYGNASNNLTKVGEMTIKWKQSSGYGAQVLDVGSFDSAATTHAINVDTKNCVATYRYGAPYSVTVNNGSCNAANGKYLEGDTVTVTANTILGITFKKWSSADVTVASETSAATTFTMPAKAVTVTANYNLFTTEPSFARTSDTEGTISFTLAATPSSAPKLVEKDSDTVVGNQSFYGGTLERSNTVTNGTGTYDVPAGEYRIAVEYSGVWFYSDVFTVDYTGIASPAAAVGNVTVSGTTGTAIAATEVNITLTNDKFNAIDTDTDVTSWFTNLPNGLEAKVKTAVNADDTTATITIIGTPTVASDAVMQIKLPAANLVSSADLTVTANANAKFNISAPTYSVNIVAGANMSTSGTANQTGLTGAMTDVVYTADTGYYFPTDYSSVGTSDGVTVTRNSYTQITVSGTPTGNVNITLADATAKTKEATPTATFTATGSDSGTLSGLVSGGNYTVTGAAAATFTASGTTHDLNSVSAGALSIVKKGNSTTTTDSTAQTITVTKAATPTGVTAVGCTAAGNDGKLQNVTTAMEYQKSGATAWTPGTGSDIIGLSDGTYLVRVKANGTELASDSQSVTINAYSSLPSEATPTATFTATGPDSGTLSNLVNGGEYAVTGAAVANFTASGTTYDLNSVSAGALSIVKKGNGTSTTDSAAQTITVTKAVTPSTVTAVGCTAAGNDGKLQNVTTAMEYQKSGATAWTPGTGSDIIGLSDGTYLVRVKANGTELASDSQSVTINAYSSLPSEATPTATFTATGSDSGTLSGLVSGGNYTVTGAAAATFTASGTTHDLNSVSTGALSIVKKGNGTTTTDSTAQTITITKAATPSTVTAVGCTTGSNNDGKLKNVTTAMEYRKSDASAWTPGTGSDITDLTNGTYYVRVKAAGTELASDNQSVVVAAYVAPTEYTITFDVNGGSSTIASQTTSGKKLSSLPTATRSGSYSFDGWYTEKNGGTKITTSTVFDKDTTVYAHWTYTGSTGGGSYTPSYTVSVDKTENGTITVSPKSASKGDTVTITVKPDKGYELEMLKALDKDGDALKLTEKNGKYTFKMPSGKVTVKGSFVEEAPVQIFKDVPTDAYYYEAVKWAAEKGITGGVGNDLFAPNQPCTRAQIVTFLWRAAGSPAPKNMSSFTDVPADAFYAKAVAWAVENAITGGTGDGKFSPNATCSRAQAVTFLYRAAGSPKVSSSAEFGDVATNAYYADAVAWAAKNGITGGIGGGLFGSGNDCTRAQIVTFLYRNYQSK